MKPASDGATDALKPGRYRHYKGKDYQVLGVATHSETGERMVVYRCLYGDFSLWVRPMAMFTSTVSVAGETVARFAYIEPMEKDNLWAGQ
ncbi:DUF1653 domain-containing protein [Marinimicrobium sp. ARAG 43.8]|uniref:DUF1653 domain-containing protein n=1 Tax=Marinimicrobium sp. ARAG 43.8 TaxID=3418719 RepID=UPI003CEB821D